MIKRIAKLAIVCAMYVAMCLIFAPVSFGIFQLRIAEILVLLCLYKKEYGISIVLGCLITNLFSPTLGLIDVAFGFIHSSLSVILIILFKNIYIAGIIPALLMFIIAFELVTFTDTEALFFPSYLMLFIEEGIVTFALGVPLFKILEKNKFFKEKVL